MPNLRGRSVKAGQGRYMGVVRYASGGAPTLAQANLVNPGDWCIYLDTTAGTAYICAVIPAGTIVTHQIV